MCKNPVVVILSSLPVILNPSPFVTLSEAKGLVRRLRINSVKNLTQSVILNEVKDLGSSFALLRTGFG